MMLVMMMMMMMLMAVVGMVVNVRLFDDAGYAADDDDYDQVYRREKP